MTHASILVVRDGGPVADGLEQCLRGLGYDVCAVAASMDEAVDRAAETAPDAALIDLGSAARRIGSEIDIPVVCLTDRVDEAPVPRAATAYPLTFVLKPFDARQLRLSLDAALALREWEGRHRETRNRLEHRNEEMREHIHMMNVVFNSMEEGVIATDQNGDRLAFNEGAARLGGLREPNSNIDEWAAMHGVFLLDEKTLLPVEENPLVLAMRGYETDGQEVFVRNEVQPQGVYVSVTGRPLKDISDRQRGGLVVFRDITAQKKHEGALRGAFAQGRLEGVDTILHNIGNAINSVTTGVETLQYGLVNDRLARRLCALAAAVKTHDGDWIDYLRNDPQGQKVRPFIISLAEDVTRNNRSLVRTMERVKDRARHIADIVRTQGLPDRAAASLRKVNLRKFLLDAVSVVQESNDDGIRFQVDCARTPKEVLIADSAFHHVLINIVTNAVQAIQQRQGFDEFPEEPCVRIRAGSAEGWLNVEVTDNGIGFADRDTRTFFSAGYTTKESGSGLGLHSAANFVIGAGGRIEISSPGLGKGATVRIGLPPPPPRITRETHHGPSCTVRQTIRP